MSTRLQPQRGIAIVTAVAVAALVATLAGFMAFRHSLWMRQVENQHDLAQARDVARSAVNLGRMTLRDDNQQNQVDHALEPWTIPIPTLPVEQGQAGGWLTDLQGRFNLNNLLRGPNLTVSPDDVAAFQRLLTAKQLSPDLANAVIDWIDADQQTTYPGGAEDMEYLALEPARRAANRVLFDINELRLVRGFSEETIKALSPFVTALPPGTPVNINFAPAEVIAAVTTMNMTEATALATKCKTQPFKTTTELNDYAQTLQGQVQTLFQQQGLLDIQSQYVQSDVAARFGRVTVAYSALINRDNGKPKLVWLHRR